MLKEWTDRSLLSRLAGYYCLENRAAMHKKRRIGPSYMASVSLRARVIPETVRRFVPRLLTFRGMRG